MLAESAIMKNSRVREEFRLAPGIWQAEERRANHDDLDDLLTARINCVERSITDIESRHRVWGVVKYDANTIVDLIKEYDWINMSAYSIALHLVFKRFWDSRPNEYRDMEW